MLARRAFGPILPVIAVTGLAVANAAAATASRDPLDAHFTQHPARATAAGCVHKPGICQLVLVGAGQVRGLGPASVTTGVTQDVRLRRGAPRTGAIVYIRRLRTSAGTLVLRASGTSHPAGARVRVTARYIVDGRASTGLFAAARGHGRDNGELPRGAVTITGTLRIAGRAGRDEVTATPAPADPFVSGGASAPPF